MLAALKTPGITKINAKKSRNHTEILFKEIGIPIKVKSYLNHDYIELRGLINFKSFNYIVPGDISSCAFFIVLTLLGNNSKLKIKNININSSRTGIIKILNKMNAKIKYLNKRKYKGEQVADILVKSKKNLIGINCPRNLNSSAIDEFLVIFLVAAKAKGISVFKGIGDLANKKSNRIKEMQKTLKQIGIKSIFIKDKLKIFGTGIFDAKNKNILIPNLGDHRICMSTFILSILTGANTKIKNF